MIGEVQPIFPDGTNPFPEGLPIPEGGVLPKVYTASDVKNAYDNGRSSIMPLVFGVSAIMFMVGYGVRGIL